MAKNINTAKILKVCDLQISNISTTGYLIAHTTKKKGIRKEDGCTGITPILNRKISAKEPNNIRIKPIMYFICCFNYIFYLNFIKIDILIFL